MLSAGPHGDSGLPPDKGIRCPLQHAQTFYFWHFLTPKNVRWGLFAEGFRQTRGLQLLTSVAVCPCTGQPSPALLGTGHLLSAGSDRVPLLTSGFLSKSVGVTSQLSHEPCQLLAEQTAEIHSPDSARTAREEPSAGVLATPNISSLRCSFA